MQKTVALMIFNGDVNISEDLDLFNFLNKTIYLHYSVIRSSIIEHYAKSAASCCRKQVVTIKYNQERSFQKKANPILQN